MTTAMIMLGVAIPDLVRLAEQRFRPAPRMGVSILAWLGLIVGAFLDPRLPWWSGVIGTLIGITWWVVHDKDPWAAVGLLLILVVGVVVETNVVQQEPVMLLAWAAAALFLTETANVICRSILRLSGRPDPTVSEQPQDAKNAQQTPPQHSPLRGGRVIGPLERVLVTVLAFFGAQAVIGALMAAKGIVRFPEISADRAGGSKAEEFLVGSLSSWALAGGSALYLWVLHNH